MHAVVIGLSGPTRSGKGSLARLLKSQLSTGEAQMRLRDVVLVEPSLTGETREAVASSSSSAAGSNSAGNVTVLSQDGFFKFEGETPDCIDWTSFEKAIRGAAQKNAVVIIEGFLLFSDKRVTCLCDRKIFLRLSKETCYSRRKATKRTGLAGERFDRFFEKMIWPSHCQHGVYDSVKGIICIDGEQTQEVVLTHALYALTEPSAANARIPCRLRDKWKQHLRRRN